MLAIILSFSPKFEAVINTIPTGIIGGISFVLYGMISAIGVRNVVENQVDFTNSRNLIMAVILVSALGFNSVGGLTFAVGGVSINLSGLAIAAIVGILLNAILPGNDYEFDSADGADASGQHQPAGLSFGSLKGSRGNFGKVPIFWKGFLVTLPVFFKINENNS